MCLNYVFLSRICCLNKMWILIDVNKFVDNVLKLALIVKLFFYIIKHFSHILVLLFHALDFWLWYGMSGIINYLLSYHRKLFIFTFRLWQHLYSSNYANVKYPKNYTWCDNSISHPIEFVKHNIYVVNGKRVNLKLYSWFCLFYFLKM